METKQSSDNTTLANNLTALANRLATAGTGNVSGTGTTGYIPQWSSQSALNNSVIYQLGSNVGIGTTTPTAKLEVAGSANITSTGTSMRVTSGGDVIIRLGV